MIAEENTSIDRHDIKKDEAMNLLMKVWTSADAGDVDAMNTLGDYHSKGLCGLKENEVEALRWYIKAANAGNTQAMTSIGVYYDNGVGCLKKDEVEALRWYRKAADTDKKVVEVLKKYGWNL